MHSQGMLRGRFRRAVPYAQLNALIGCPACGLTTQILCKARLQSCMHSHLFPALSTYFNDPISSFSILPFLNTGLLLATLLTMVLEALAAVSLAGNIVQFISFTTRVLSETKKAYSAGTGESACYVDLHSMSCDLEDVSIRIQYPARTITADHTLLDLASRCQTISKNLQTALDGLKIDRTQSHKRWTCFRHALRAVWGSKKIEQLASQMAQIQHELNLRLNVENW